MRTTCVVVGLVAIASVSGADRPEGPRYRVRQIPGILGGDDYSRITDLNNHGQACGHDPIGFRWDSVTNETIPLSDVDTGAQESAINDLGHITGGTILISPDCRRGWLWTPEDGFHMLGQFPGGACSNGGTAINNLDQIAGGWSLEGRPRAFLWDPVDGFIDIGVLNDGEWAFSIAYGINDNSYVVGVSSSPFSSNNAFLWTPDAGMIGLDDMYDDPVPDSSANAINELGHVVGYAASPGGQEAFFWTPEEGMIGLGFLNPAGFTEALDINDRDEVVGWGYWAYHQERSFIWDQVRGMRNLSDLIDPCLTRPPRSPVYNVYARAINNDGQIAADRLVSINAYAVLLTPYLRGDFDEDMDVDLADLIVPLASFGRAGDAMYADGDLDCDADVDLQDLATLLSNFGEVYP